MKIYVLVLAIFLGLGTATACAKDSGKAVTLEGIVEEAKGGLYVEDVLITDGDLAKMQKTRKDLVGKKVKITGRVHQETAKDPNVGKDPAKDLMLQSRVGSWREMERIDSIEIVP